MSIANTPLGCPPGVVSRHSPHQPEGSGWAGAHASLCPRPIQTYAQDIVAYPVFFKAVARPVPDSACGMTVLLCEGTTRDPQPKTIHAINCQIPSGSCPLAPSSRTPSGPPSVTGVAHRRHGSRDNNLRRSCWCGRRPGWCPVSGPLEVLFPGSVVMFSTAFMVGSATMFVDALWEVELPSDTFSSDNPQDEIPAPIRRRLILRMVKFPSASPVSQKQGPPKRPQLWPGPPAGPGTVTFMRRSGRTGGGSRK